MAGDGTGFMANNSALYVTGACALSQSAYLSWGGGLNASTAVGFTQNKNGTLLFKDHASGSWTELGNSRDNTQLGDAAADVITANGQLTASQGISSTLNSNFDANVTLGNAASDIITSTGQLTASQGISSTLNSNFDANVTLGNAAADVITSTGQFTASQGALFNNDVFSGADNTHNLGSAALRWANVYAGDLHLKNDRGDWTILEEENYLCVVNNKTQKRYKMVLEEVED